MNLSISNKENIIVSESVPAKSKCVASVLGDFQTGNELFRCYISIDDVRQLAKKRSGDKRNSKKYDKNINKQTNEKKIK